MYSKQRRKIISFMCFYIGDIVGNYLYLEIRFWKYCMVFGVIVLFVSEKR